MLIAHKTRLHPNNKQKAFFKQCSGFRRFAYNWALGKIKDQYELNNNTIRIGDVDKLFNVAKREKFQWSYELPACVGQEAIKNDLKSGMNNFFRNVKKGINPPGYPKFKSKSSSDSFSLTNVIVRQKHITKNKLVLPKKMGSVRLGDAVRFDGKLMSTTISRQGERWYASFLIDTYEDLVYKQPDLNTVIGVDVGVKHYASLSNGEIFEPSGALKRYKSKLLREQRKLSNMQKPEYKKGVKASNNWKKQNEKLRKLYRKITQFRENYAHQTTTNLVERFDTIVIEDLKVSQMTKSAKCTVELPGENVKAKSNLNNSILDGGFYQFRNMLEYKSDRRGGKIIAVNPAYTSQTCPSCNHVSEENRPTRDTFECTNCGHKGHADIVAANNILNKGISLQLDENKA